jgi:hypothetical protein
MVVNELLLLQLYEDRRREAEAARLAQAVRLAARTASTGDTRLIWRVRFVGLFRRGRVAAGVRG